MKLQEVEKRVAEIIKNDDNVEQHEMEDKLNKDFIKAIFFNKYSTIQEIEEIAKKILNVNIMDFTRHYE